MTMQARIHRGACRLPVVLGLLGLVGLPAWSQEEDAPPPSQEAQRSEYERAEKSEHERAELESRYIEARVRAEYLEMELGIEKCQIERLMKVIKESELAEVLGASEGSIIADEKKLDRARKLLEERKQSYLERSRELARIERRRDELGARLDEASGAETMLAGSRRLSDIARRLDEAIDAMNREEGDEAPKEHGRVSEVLRGIQSLLKAFEDDDP